MRRRDITDRARAANLSAPNFSVVPSRMRGFDELRALAKRGISIGVPRSTALEHYRPFPVLELEVRRESLPTEQVFGFLIEHSHARIIWHVAIDDEHEAKPFSSDDWKLFITLLSETKERDHILVLGYDRSVAYSSDLLDAIESFRDEMSAVPVLLDAEHATWKTKRAEQVMKSLRLPQVFLDAPSLPGIVKDAAYHTGPLAILRCLGRNKRTWFEHKAEERFEYAYSDAELQEVAQRVKHLKEAHDQVCIVFCNRPAPAAIANALQLGRMLT